MVLFAVQVALVARFGGTPCQRLLGVTVRGAAAVRVLAIWAFWGATMCLAFVPLLAAAWHNGRHGVLPWDRLAGTRLAWSS